MCGIAGFVGKGSETDGRAMIAALHHRGPDDTGVEWMPGMCFTQARLSIIDLSPAGHEPMWNHAKTVLLTFNGEIYNFEELRAKYVPDYPYRGRSDAEVILALYDRFGADCFKYLNGMFALALWDTTQEALYLARDRMGKKPLYWTQQHGVVAFASEPKALFVHPLIARELNPAAVNAYLTLDYVPTPHSIWKGVHKLPPASVLRFQKETHTTSSFWSPSFKEEGMSMQDALALLDLQLAHATAARLVSDVPLGVFLSGGLDSSTVAYYAQRASEQPIHTFSIGFRESTFDESPYAAAAAAALGTVHHTHTASAEESLAALPQLLSRMDEPVADASLIPTWLLAQFAKQHVSVALGGDGADELFAGYPTFEAERAASLYRALPAFMQNLANGAVSLVPHSEGYMSLGFKARKFLDGAQEADPVTRHLHWLGTFSAPEREALLGDAWSTDSATSPFESAHAYFSEAKEADPRDALLYLYQRTYLMDQVLVKVDRASMQHALEVRAPFLDYELVEFVNQLPYSYKLRGGTTKYLLKRLMRGKLPDASVTRSKQGFGVPVGAWLRGPLHSWGEELIAGSKDSILDGAVLAQLWKEHKAGVDHRKKLWNVLSFLAWQRNFFQGANG